MFYIDLYLDRSFLRRWKVSNTPARDACIVLELDAATLGDAYDVAKRVYQLDMWNEAGYLPPKVRELLVAGAGHFGAESVRDITTPVSDSVLAKEYMFTHDDGRWCTSLFTYDDGTWDWQYKAPDGSEWSDAYLTKLGAVLAFMEYLPAVFDAGPPPADLGYGSAMAFHTQIDTKLYEIWLYTSPHGYSSSVSVYSPYGNVQYDALVTPDTCAAAVVAGLERLAKVID